MTAHRNYIDSSEYVRFGLSVSTTVEQVNNASDTVDAYINRPEGLLWEPDSLGAPLCMVRKQSESPRTLVSGILAGTNVPATFSPGPIICVGEAVVLNRAKLNGNASELCYVASVQGNTVVLAQVIGAHLAAESVELGLVIDETIALSKNRNVATVGKGPIARLVSVVGRTSYGRRGNSVNAVSDVFGAAPLWRAVPVTSSDVDKTTGQIWCSTGALMLPYTEVRVVYVAGYVVKSLPSQVKQATANVVRAIAESPATANVKTYRAGETQMERFLDSVIDGDTRNILAPYMASYFG